MRFFGAIICMALGMQLTACSGLLYYPSGQLYFPPERFGLKPEEVHFASKAGPKLFGWYFQNKAGKPPKALVVFYHGNAENMSSHYANIFWILEHGYDLFVFDYQGYGRSEGSPSPLGTKLDGEAALEWAAARAPGVPLVIFGQSLGGAVALRNAVDMKDRVPLRFVAVDSTFSSYRSVARKVLSRSWITWPFQWLGWLLMSDEYAAQGELGKIAPIPLLVMHGDQDQVVEFEFGERVFAEARNPKEFWRIAGGAHTDVFHRQDVNYRYKFLEKLKQVLGK